MPTPSASSTTFWRTLPIDDGAALDPAQRKVEREGDVDPLRVPAAQADAAAADDERAPARVDPVQLRLGDREVLEADVRRLLDLDAVLAPDHDEVAHGNAVG